MREHRLVIIDCDGVLVDTEHASSIAIARFFTELELTLTAEECRRLFQGKSMEDVCAEMAERAGIANDPALPQRVRGAIEFALKDLSAPIAGDPQSKSHNLLMAPRSSRG